MNGSFEQLLIDDAVFGVQLPPGDKVSSFRHIGRAFAVRWALTPEQERLVVDGILMRDQTRSCGIGHGLAIPHTKVSLVNEIRVGWFTPVQPMDFGSIDARPVHIILALVSPPTRTSDHITCIAKVSRLLCDEAVRLALYADLRTIQTPDQLRDRIHRLVAVIG